MTTKRLRHIDKDNSDDNNSYNNNKTKSKKTNNNTTTQVANINLATPIQEQEQQKRHARYLIVVLVNIADRKMKTLIFQILGYE